MLTSQLGLTRAIEHFGNRHRTVRWYIEDFDFDVGFAEFDVGGDPLSLGE